MEMESLHLHSSCGEMCNIAPAECFVSLFGLRAGGVKWRMLLISEVGVPLVSGHQKP